MRAKLSVLLFSFSLLTAGIGLCQGTESAHGTFQDANWNFKVKQIDDFINRFNNQISYQQNKQSLSFQLREEEYRRLLQNMLEGPEGEMADQFISKVIEFNQSDKLSFLDSGWYAETEIQVGYEGMTLFVPMVLSIVKDSSVGHKWAISAIGLPKTKIWTLGFNEEKFINPANHSLRFSDFEYLIDGEGDFTNLLSSDLEIDQRSIFLFFAASGKFDSITTTGIRYHFLQFPNYVFVVDNFDRESPKSGWLISEIFEADEAFKNSYLTNLFLSTDEND